MLQNRKDSFKYAFKGVLELLTNHTNFKIQIGFAFLASALGFMLKINQTEWLAIVIVITMVLTAEGLNTAIEFAVDLSSPDHHPLAAKAKDVAAGAVIICSLGALIIGLIIFAPKLKLLLLN